MSAFHGQMGMFVRALAFILSHGADGLRQASEDAVLSANYVRACLNDLMSAPFGDRPCMHEALFDDRWLKDTGITTLDFAKAMIDEGFHPMTVYFPLVVHGAMLIEPTESESKASLDLFIMTLRDLAFAAKAGDRERFVAAPIFAPRRRLDETRAARQPVLRWTHAARRLPRLSSARGNGLECGGSELEYRLCAGGSTRHAEQADPFRSIGRSLSSIAAVLRRRLRRRRGVGPHRADRLQPRNRAVRSRGFAVTAPRLRSWLRRRPTPPRAPASPTPAAPAAASPSTADALQPRRCRLLRPELPSTAAAPRRSQQARRTGAPHLAPTLDGQTVELAARPFAYVEGKADRDEIYAAIMARRSASSGARSTRPDSSRRASRSPSSSSPTTPASATTPAIRSKPRRKARPACRTPSSSARRPAGKAMRFQHLGAYADIDATYDAITAYLDEKGIDAAGFLHRGIRERREGRRRSEPSGRHLRADEVSLPRRIRAPNPYCAACAIALKGAAPASNCSRASRA